MTFQLISRRVHLYLGMFSAALGSDVCGQFSGLQPLAGHLCLGRTGQDNL